MLPLGGLNGCRDAGRVKSIANQPLSEENLLENAQENLPFCAFGDSYINISNSVLLHSGIGLN